MTGSDPHVARKGGVPQPSTPDDIRIEEAAAALEGVAAPEVGPSTLNNRPLIYGYIADCENASTSSLDAALAVLLGKMSLPENGKILMCSVSGDIARMNPQPDSREAALPIDDEQLYQFCDQFPPSQIGFIVYGGNELREIIEEQGTTALCNIPNVFSALDSPCRFAVLFRGIADDPIFNSLEDAMGQINAHRHSVGLADIDLYAWTEGQDLRALRALLELGFSKPATPHAPES